MKKLLWLSAAALFMLSCNNNKKSSSGGGGGALASGDAVALKLNLKPGESFNQNMKMDMNMNMEVMGQKMDMKMNIGSGMKFAAKQLNADGGMDMDMTYTNAAATMDMGALGGAAGAGAMNDILKKVMDAMVGETVSISLNKNGELTRASGFERIKENLVRKADSLGLPEASVDQMVEGFAEKNLDANMKMLFAIYPDKPVKPGDTWVKESVQEVNNIKMKMKNEYTLNKVEGSTAHIALKSTAAGKGSMRQGATEVELDMDLTQAGTLEMNIANGVLKAGKMDMKVDATVNAGGMKAPMKMNANYTISN
jgi:hypothetical protein